MMSPTAHFRQELKAAVMEARGASEVPSSRPALRLASSRAVALRPTPPRPIAPPKRTVVRLWLPLTPLWIILAPFALIAAPLLALVPEARGVSPWRAAWSVGGVLLSLSGTVVDVDSPTALIRIRIL
ncbi:MAG: hypothetical protein ACHP7N_10095 [Caulobacterales bacterium]